MFESLEREVIPYTTEEAWLEHRLADITSTEISSLFASNPYETEFALWYRKRDREQSNFVDSERTAWGRRLQNVIASGIAEDYGWKMSPLTDYIRIPSLRLGSSFDFEIENYKDGEPAICEIKNVDFAQFNQKWDVRDMDKYVEGPPHIELQVQQQMLIRGYRYAVLGVFVGGNSLRILEREALPDVHLEIVSAAKEFWASIAADKPPEPDYERDWRRIFDLHRNISKTETIRIDDDGTFDDLCETCYEAKRRCEEYMLINRIGRAKLLSLLGEAKVGIGKRFRTTTWSMKENTYTVKREATSAMRVTPIAPESSDGEGKSKRRKK